MEHVGILLKFLNRWNLIYFIGNRSTAVTGWNYRDYQTLFLSAIYISLKTIISNAYITYKSLFIAPRYKQRIKNLLELPLEKRHEDTISKIPPGWPINDLYPSVSRCYIYFSELPAAYHSFHKAYVCFIIVGKKWNYERLLNFALNWESWPQKRTKELNLRTVTMLWIVREYLRSFRVSSWKRVNRRRRKRRVSMGQSKSGKC